MLCMFFSSKSWCQRAHFSVYPPFCQRPLVPWNTKRKEATVSGCLLKSRWIQCPQVRHEGRCNVQPDTLGETPTGKPCWTTKQHHSRPRGRGQAQEMARKDQGEKEQANQKEEPNPREETPQKAAQHDATHTHKKQRAQGAPTGKGTREHLNYPLPIQHKYGK